MNTQKSYRDEAFNDARDTVTEYMDTIVEQLLNESEASSDLMSDYPGGDSYHHESHTDKYLTLREAAEILYELAEFEETDSGLWEDFEPHDAVKAQAAYTYGNAVMAMFHDLIKEINDSYSRNVDSIQDGQAELQALADSLESLEDQDRAGELNDVKLKVLENLRQKAKDLTPEAIEKSTRAAVEKLVQDCLDK